MGGNARNVQKIPRQLQIIRNPDSNNRRLRSCRAAVFGGVFSFFLFPPSIERIVCDVAARQSGADWAYI
jgi:hypothetical protein